MKVGDLVKFKTTTLLDLARTRRYQTASLANRPFGCLPDINDERWSGHGIVLEVSGGNINVLWPKEGAQLVDNRFLELVSESR